MKRLLLLLIVAVCQACVSNLVVRNNHLYYDGVLVGELTSQPCEGVTYCDVAEQIDDQTVRIVRTFTATESVDSVRLTLNFCHTSPH